ncbi:MAG: SMP-30/gluconolactonase/LRE family protein [Beijerinckiaceae bacterium]
MTGAVRIIGRDDVLPVQAANAVTGEVPYWDAPSATLWWVDIQGQRLIGFRPSDAETTIHNLPSMAGVLAGRRAGGMVIGLEDGLYAIDPVLGLGERLVAVETDKPLNRLNEGKADPAGRLWFGSLDKTGQFLPQGALYRLDLDGSLTAVRTGMRIPNAIDFSPDGKRMYLADSPERRIEVMDYDAATGKAGAPRLFLETPDCTMPDGCCVDAEGAVWVAIIGGGRIERRLPNGDLHTVIELPVSRPTMPMLGGPDGRTMFITCQRRLLSPEALKREALAGDLLALRVDVPARAVNLAAV